MRAVLHTMQPAKLALALVGLTLVVASLSADCLPVDSGAKEHEHEAEGNAHNADYWRQRRADFYRNTTFELNDFNLQLLGRKRTLFENRSSLPRGHLPFWFDYELFKRVFNKRSAGEPAEELRRHHAYLSECVRTLKRRTLFRMLAGTQDTRITSAADQFYWERAGQLPAESERAPAGNEQQPISALVHFKFLPAGLEAAEEAPLARAIRLVRQEMDQVESKNQVETYLKAFNEIDGSAIDGQLPY